ncbi:J domain-containing protein [Trinickia caryophylli]|uniref:DnaJ domain-containing protein n=1 Tax=Trinickia caryophylli TaxID=28094 RepID=A0A1X7G2R7_TRICW|nr:J domain-containing protein [Trinickia caryophylli]PMS13723.1 J domain-containing protein [Trinickia caryophylli]TRX14214.1 J domain-containing protein [Trinickia caryophylli]WQE14040.1 J domain-containing protein [Trinickia caryophylli]SMF63014.1 DnaJ domain-containing protein [Trinickia caryophylli]GLU33471.1 hypothetical protein Busp01_33130 [Trinickia caryophylli]
MATLYDTLGVHEDATGEEIKRAYRKAAMRSHPDRNVGREAQARAAFQQVKEAYAILSDPEQRRVYDAVFAEEMRRLAQHREEARLREEQALAQREAEYAALVRTAMRFAERGRNRDVVFGVLLGRGCEEALAARIADGVSALFDERVAGEAGAQADEQADEQEAAARAPAQGAPAVRKGGGPDGAKRGAARCPAADSADDSMASDHAEEPVTGAQQYSHANFFRTVWHGMFGLRS